MIGSKLREELIGRGHTVIGIDRRGEEVHEGNDRLYVADLADKDQLCKIIEETAPDRVIHLAALAHTEGEADLSWERYEHINVYCARNVFEAAGERPVLFISTVDVFGFTDGVVGADTQPQPISNYAKSKYMAEQECKKLKNFDIFRFSPVYTETTKRDIQKRYYLKYPNIAYLIGRGSMYEILNVNKAIKAMADWCETEPTGTIRIIKDDEPMFTKDYIKRERAAGRAKLVLWFPRPLINFAYAVLIKTVGKNNKTYLLNKAVHPLRTR